MKKTLLTLAAMLMATTAAFAQKAYNEVFPANFSSGVPTGWQITDNATYETVNGGLKINCTQDAPKFRADLKYNTPTTVADNYFTIDASKYKVFAISFIGNRPTSGALKLGNISVNGFGWIKGKSGYSLNESGWTDLVDAAGNHTYYWTVGGDNWTGNLTIDKIEIVIADITDASQKSYIVSKVNWYDSEETLKDELGLGTKPIVVNETTGKKYETLSDAWKAAVSGDVLVLNEDVTLKERLNTDGRQITIKGAGHTISRDGGYTGMLFLTSNSGDDRIINLENVTIDGVNKQTSGQTIEAGNWGRVNLTDVKFQNCNTTNELGVIGVKNGGSLSVNGVSFANCTVPEGFGEIFGGTNGISVSGTNDASVFLEGAYYVTDNGVDGGTVTMLFNPDQNGSFKRTMDASIVNEVKAARYFTCGVEGYKLVANEDKLFIAEDNAEPVVENLTTNVKYDNFMAAYNAAVTDDVLSIVAPEVIMTSRTPMKSITIEGATGTEKIVQNIKNSLLFNTGSNSNMTFKNLTFESLEGPGSAAMFEHNASAKNGHTLTFDKVTLKKISSSNANGLFNIKQGVLALNDVTFDDCTVSNAAGFVNINEKNMLRLSGANEGLTVNLSAFNSIEVSDILTNTTPIKLTLSDDMLASVGTATQADGVANAVVIPREGEESVELDASKFTLTNDGYRLELKDGNLVLMVGTGVEEIFGDENAPVEYFNLQGIKVANPEKGIFIKRQGEKVTKVIF